MTMCPARAYSEEESQELVAKTQAAMKALEDLVATEKRILKIETPTKYLRTASIDLELYWIGVDLHQRRLNGSLPS